MNSRLKAYLQLLRLPALFTAWADILAAHFIVSADPVQWSTLVLLLGVSSALYLGGMVLNDCCDYREDLEERPFRPLPSGRIARDTAWRLAVLLLAAGVLLAAGIGGTQLLIASLLALAVVAYDCHLKQGALGPWVMASCRYLNWLLGLSVMPLSLHSFLLPIPILFYIVALTILGRSETQGGDRRAIVQSLLGVLTMLIAVGVLYTTGFLQAMWPLLVAIPAVLYLVISLWHSLEKMTPRVIQRNMKLFLLGIIPLDAFLALAAGPWWGGLAVLALLLPGYLLARSLYVT